MFLPQTSAFLLALIGVGLPVATLLAFSPTFRRHAFFSVPIGAAVFLLVGAITAAVLYSYVSFGWAKLFIVLTIATVSMFFTHRIIDRIAVSPDEQIYDLSALYIILGLSALAIADNFFILSQQGFQANQATYFRTPLHSDNERHLILVNAIIRGDGSPFLSGAEHRYQILWHHFAAIFVSVLSDASMPSYYPLVSGIVLFTSYIFFVALFWLAYLMRPTLFRGYWVFVVFVLVAMHADIYNFITSSLAGYPGIEADASIPMPYFRNFSAKLAALTAPQHVLFLIVLILYLAFRHLAHTLASGTSMNRSDILVPMMGVTSPVLTVFYLPFSALYDCIYLVRREGWKAAIRYAIKIAGLAGLGLAFFWVIMRFPPADLFFRDSPWPLWENDWTALNIIFAPFAALPALIAISGTLGLALSILILWLLRARRFAVLNDSNLIVALTIILVANFLLGNFEIRRHTSILIYVLLLVAVFRFLGPVEIVMRSAFHKGLLIVIVVVTTLLHGYYIYSYAGKPSAIPVNISWEDYLCMNKFIAEYHPHTPTWASMDRYLRFPLVMEVVPSFSNTTDIYIHSMMPPHAKSVLETAEQGIPSPASLKELGYKLIVWGPIEKNVLEKSTLVDLIRPENQIARCESVGLYALK